MKMFLIRCLDASSIYKENIMKKVVTHNGVFHADEVVAVALLHAFGQIVKVSRLQHQTNLEEVKFDMAIDIGRKFDGERHFDHHQYTGGKASAGLILDFLGVAADYPEIAELVALVDANDVGEKKAGKWEFPAMVAAYNAANIYGEEQNAAFEKAVAFAVDQISALKRAQDELAHAEKIIANSVMVEDMDILELQEFVLNWNVFVNGTTRPEVGSVMWYDATQNCWKAQVTPVAAGSFDFHGRKFLQAEGMNFVHAAGFFAVADSRERMIDFLKNNREE